MGVAMRDRIKNTIVGSLAGLLFFTGGVAAQAQYREDHIPAGPPMAVPNPQIVEKHNAQLSLAEAFTRSDGTKVKLGDLFNHKKPVILSLVYFSCPSLCNFTQSDLVNAVIQGPRSLRLGADYDIVVVSIDPADTPELAAAKRTNYLGLMKRPESQPGFTYLTGSEANIGELADTVGFGYQQNFGVAADDPAGKFAHASGIFVCTPDGRLSQTILGINYDPDKLHNALLTASNGKIGSGFLETIALPCGAMRFNPNTGKYENNPWFWAGTAGGGASILFMAIFMGIMWRGEWKKHKQQAAADAGTPDDQTPASPE